MRYARRENQRRRGSGKDDTCPADRRRRESASRLWRLTVAGTRERDPHAGV